MESEVYTTSFRPVPEPPPPPKPTPDPVVIACTEAVCRLLPRELRNEIYKYLFTPNTKPPFSESRPGNLISALAPILNPKCHNPKQYLPAYIKPGWVHDQFATEAVEYLYSHFPQDIWMSLDPKPAECVSIAEHLAKDHFGVGTSPGNCTLRHLRVHLPLKPDLATWDAAFNHLDAIANLDEAVGRCMNLSIVFEHEAHAFELARLTKLFRATEPLVKRFGQIPEEPTVYVRLQELYKKQTDEDPEWKEYITKGPHTSVEIIWIWDTGDLVCNVSQGSQFDEEQWRKGLGKALPRLGPV